MKQGDRQKALDSFVQATIIVGMLSDAFGNVKQRINFLVSPLIKQVLECGDKG